jgi:hypothetical protein
MWRAPVNQPGKPAEYFAESIEWRKQLAKITTSIIGDCPCVRQIVNDRCTLATSKRHTPERAPRARKRCDARGRDPRVVSICSKAAGPNCQNA